MTLASVVAIGLGIGTSFVVGPSAAGQGAPTKPSVTVWLIVQKPGGDPTGYLSAKDFRVTQGGRDFKVDVVQPTIGSKGIAANSIPTRVLVFCDARLGNDPRVIEEIVGKLRPFFSRGWQLSLVLPDGMQTDYIGSMVALNAALRANRGAHGLNVSGEDAAETLRGFPGRRVVLYVSTTTGGWTQTKVPFEIRNEAMAAMAQVYVVDGGRPSGSESYRDAPTYARIPGSASGVTDMKAEMQIPYPAEDLFKFGWFHEIDLNEAVRSALKDAVGFYKLQIECGSGSCPNAGSPVSIHIGRKGPLRVTAMGTGDAKDFLFDVSTK